MSEISQILENLPDREETRDWVAKWLKWIKTRLRSQVGDERASQSGERQRESPEGDPREGAQNSILVSE